MEYWKGNASIEKVQNMGNGYQVMCSLIILNGSSR